MSHLAAVSNRRGFKEPMPVNSDLTRFHGEGQKPCPPSSGGSEFARLAVAGCVQFRRLGASEARIHGNYQKSESFPMAERIFGREAADRFTLPARSATWQATGPADRAQIQEIVDRLSRWMDTAFEIPGVGWRFGFDAIIGLIPGIGDLATTLVSLYILLLASRTGLPRITLARMGVNVAIDMILGSLPLVGDVFDVWWKANQKNAALLGERLSQTPIEARRATASDWIFVSLMLVALVILLAAIVALVALIASMVWHAAGSLFRS
jgi:hypothetical protein